MNPRYEQIKESSKLLFSFFFMASQAIAFIIAIQILYEYGCDYLEWHWIIVLPLAIIIACIPWVNVAVIFFGCLYLWEWEWYWSLLMATLPIVVGHVLIWPTVMIHDYFDRKQNNDYDPD